MIQLLGQLPGGAQIGVELLDHMDREANGAGLVHQRPLHGLANPPGGVGGEAVAQFGIEFFHGADQAQVTLFDQVQESEAAIDVATGDFHHQAQVGLDHVASGFLVALLDQARVVDLFLCGEQGGKADLPKIEVGGIHDLFVGKMAGGQRFLDSLLRVLLAVFEGVFRLLEKAFLIAHITCLTAVFIG